MCLRDILITRTYISFFLNQCYRFFFICFMRKHKVLCQFLSLPLFVIKSLTVLPSLALVKEGRKGGREKGREDLYGSHRQMQYYSRREVVEWQNNDNCAHWHKHCSISNSCTGTDVQEYNVDMSCDVGMWRLALCLLLPSYPSKEGWPWHQEITAGLC